MRRPPSGPAGNALAWGDNTHGELGDGTTGGISSTPVPVDLPPGTHITAVSAGDDFSLALTSDGTVLAWGDNGAGPLGDGGTSDSSRPVPVDLPTGTRITAISAGYDFGLALTSHGSVLAWGDNIYGELGDDEVGDYGAPDNFMPVPVAPPADAHVTAISAAYDYSLALTSDGSVLGWGDNNGLGDGIFDNGQETGVVAVPPITVDLPAGTHVTAISADDGGGLVLTSDGALWAWGGTLANGFANINNIPVRVDLPAGTHVTAISAGSSYNLVLTSDGRLLAWGDNTYGELGNGTTTDSSTPVPVDLPACTRVTAVSAGSDYNVALAEPTSCRH